MKRRIRIAAGILLSLLLLGWALRDVSMAEVLRRVRAAHMGYFSLALLIALATFWIRAFRWGILLRPISGSIPFQPRLSATFIGFAVNNLLPARMGEFARVISLSRLTSVSVASAFATLVIERMLDGLVVVALLFAVMGLPGFPVASAVGNVNLGSAALAMAGVMAAVGVGLGLAVSAPTLAARIARLVTRPLPTRLRDPAINALRSFAGGLAILRSPGLFISSVFLAIFQWVFAGLSFLYAFRAFDIRDVPFTGAIFLQSLLSLAVSIPSSPGFFGPFEAASKVGLSLWGVSEEQAAAFAIAFHIGGFIPVTIIGIYYVWKLNLSWSAISRGDQSAEGEMPGSPPPSGSRA